MKNNLKYTEKSGGFTLPTEKGESEEALKLVKKWAADAVRNSDGTELPEVFLDHQLDIYSTICLVRADQMWPRQHKEHLCEKFLMSQSVTAVDETLEIDPLKGYYDKKYEIDLRNNPADYWEVINRTLGNIIDADSWHFDKRTQKLIIENAIPFNVYTVNFLVFLIWDSTSMYNHLINGWNCDPVISLDPYHKQVKEHLYAYFDNWLMKNKKTSVVRLTTLAYHFTLDSDENARDKYRDWLGYTDCVSPQALADFEKRFGYTLKSEDFVDQGYYNATYRVPSVQYLDWMQFIQDFVFDYGKTLVNKIHSSGKKAAVFWGDHWIGLEPYSDNYKNYGFDISIGACEDGVALRRLSDCPADHTKEARLYPYFFPDVFNEKGDPITESIRNWVKIRRAMLRVPIDRIGYGGYLGLAYNYPGFIEHVQYIRNQFSDILENTQKTKPFTQSIKVAILSVWGKLRSWINTVGPDQKFHVGRADINEITGPNMLECLSGLPLDVSFISFADIEENGIPSDVDIIINEGAAGTAWSGGDHWKSTKVQSEIRRWVANGGGLLGITEPCAVRNGGSFIQLKDVFGVEKETGNTINFSIPKAERPERHFITDNTNAKPNFSTKSYIYPISCETRVLKTDDHGHVCLAVNEYDKGRGAYISGISYSLNNADLLYRTLLWLSRNEKNLKKWYCENVNIGCAAFPETGRFVVYNNVSDIQKGRVYDNSGKVIKIQLHPYEMKWLDIS